MSTTELIKLGDGREVTPDEAALIWVNRYRNNRGMHVLAEMPETLGQATNGELKFHRNQEEVCFAITKIAQAAAAASRAGTGIVRPYLRDPKDPDSKHWDISLPSYLWPWSK